MRTSFDLPDDLIAQAKLTAKARACSVRDLVEEGLRRVLGEEGAKQRPFVLSDKSFRGEGLNPELAGGEWERIRALAYQDPVAAELPDEDPLLEG